MSQNSFEWASKSGLYRIKNLVNGRLYVGSAVDISKRWYDHKRLLQQNKHSNKFLQADFLKCGREAFVFEVVCFCKPENLLKYEQWLLDLRYDNQEQCYNFAKNARATMLGKNHSIEARAKITSSLIGNKRSPGGAVGREMSDAFRKKMSLFMTGKKLRLGKRHTEETKMKISMAKKGQKYQGVKS